MNKIFTINASHISNECTIIVAGNLKILQILSMPVSLEGLRDSTGGPGFSCGLITLLWDKKVLACTFGRERSFNASDILLAKVFGILQVEDSTSLLLVVTQQTLSPDHSDNWP